MVSPEFQLGFYTELMKISQEVASGPPPLSAPNVVPKPNPPGSPVPAVTSNQQAAQKAGQLPPVGFMGGTQ